MKNKDKEEIEKIIKEFFNKMGFEAEIERSEEKESTFSLNLKTPEPQMLIGRAGATLIEIQKILGKILRKKIGRALFLDLDINGYKKNKIEYLKDLAQATADEVSLEKKEKALPPMPSYERRIVHLALANREDVQTQSQGEEPERRVVIKPK